MTPDTAGLSDHDMVQRTYGLVSELKETVHDMRGEFHECQREISQIKVDAARTGAKTGALWGAFSAVITALMVSLAVALLKSYWIMKSFAGQ